MSAASVYHPCAWRNKGGFVKSARGFTLLEVLVALVLIGLLMVVLFGGFRAGINSWRIADQHSMRVEEPRQLSGLLYRHLGQLLPARFAADEQGNIQPSFTGEKGRMLYIAPLSMSSGSVPYVFEVISRWQGRPGIWARYAPYHPNKSAQELLSAADFVQISASLQADFAYFGEAEPGAEPAWHNEYSNLQKPPKLVSFRLSGDERQWPALTFTVVQVSNEPPPALRFVR